MTRPALFCAALLLAAFALLAQSSRGTFVPPRATYATDLNYPVESSTAGLVSLSVGLDRDGHIVSSETLRDLPALTARSLISVNNWTFTPATLDGKQTESVIAVDILFNPRNVASAPVHLDAPMRPARQMIPDYVPVQVESAVFAANPADTLTSGPVVLDVLVGASGRVQNASAIYGSPPLTGAAISAVEQWRFIPAHFRGASFPATVAVVFVFRPPPLPNPPGSAPPPQAPPSGF